MDLALFSVLSKIINLLNSEVNVRGAFSVPYSENTILLSHGGVTLRAEKTCEYVLAIRR